VCLLILRDANQSSLLLFVKINLHHHRVILKMTICPHEG
jgi:hypothetical protein